MNAAYARDLALARRCAAGEEQAWQQFVLEFRPVLYRAADALDPSGGEEIKQIEPIDRVPRMLQATELTDGLPFHDEEEDVEPVRTR